MGESVLTCVTTRKLTGIASRFLLIAAVLLSVVLVPSCAPKGTVRVEPRPPHVSLVLGAGAARGFAHIGVLKVLEANGIPLSSIVGTSAGSFVGSLYAYGFSVYDLQKMSFALEKTDILDVTIPDNGFIKGEKLEAYINNIVRNAPLEKMKIPFYAVAADILTGQEVVFGRGNTGKAVRASCAIPGIFRPVVIDGRMYVDGGVVSPVAVNAARRQGADIVIAVDISSESSGARPEGTIETILQSIDVMHARLSAAQLSRADIVIRPRVGHIGSADFSKRHEAVLEGEKAAGAALNSIKALLSAKRQ